jgi:Ankyrin repeats (3 copies)
MAPTTRSQTRRAHPNALIKLLRTGRKHYDQTYTEGLNICAQPWNAESCTPGGLYACELRHIFEWISLYPDITEAAWVDVPADALVARFNIKIKASKLVLTGFMPLAKAVTLALQAGANINTQALFNATYKGHTECVRLLLQAGANVHAQADKALRYASYNGHTECVRLLLQAGADAHAQGDEALCWASCNGHTECVRLLQSYM